MFLIEGDGKAILYTGDIRGMQTHKSDTSQDRADGNVKPKLGGSIALSGIQSLFRTH